MRSNITLLILMVVASIACSAQPIITPIEHASLVLSNGTTTIYIDPVGKIDQYKSLPSPDLILITHAHGDHFQPDLINEIKTNKTEIIANKSVIDKLGFGKALANGDSADFAGMKIEAVPMYNTTPDRLKFHPKGDGNGYVFTFDGQKFYISGDTEDIPEMKNLSNIDHAFICMNLPYTMTEEQAVTAVMSFKPAKVYPYHYRGKNGFADINKFRRMISARDKNIEVVSLKWY